MSSVRQNFDVNPFQYLGLSPEHSPGTAPNLDSTRPELLFDDMPHSDAEFAYQSMWQITCISSYAGLPSRHAYGHPNEADSQP